MIPFEGHVILRKLENLIDFQFTQFNFQNIKDLAMKLWRLVENMLMEVSELFIVRIKKKINYAKSVKAYMSF